MIWFQSIRVTQTYTDIFMFISFCHHIMSLSSPATVETGSTFFYFCYFSIYSSLFTSNTFPSWTTTTNWKRTRQSKTATQKRAPFIRNEFHWGNGNARYATGEWKWDWFHCASTSAKLSYSVMSDLWSSFGD